MRKIFLLILGLCAFLNAENLNGANSNATKPSIAAVKEQNSTDLAIKEPKKGAQSPNAKKQAVMKPETSKSHTAAMQKNAAEAILGDVRTESAAYIKAMDAATARLNAAHKKKARNDAWEALKELALVVVAFAIGGYIANWAIFKWYEIPTKVDAVNNALWQLLNR